MSILFFHHGDDQTFQSRMDKHVQLDSSDERLTLKTLALCFPYGDDQTF